MDRKPSFSASSDPEKVPNSEARSGASDRSETPLLVDDALERRVWRKLDWYVLPVVSMFYFLSFLVSNPKR